MLLIYRVQNSGCAINGDNMPFDLMCNSSPITSRQLESRRNPLILPLDLPPSVEQHNNSTEDDVNDIPLNRQRTPRQNSTNDIPLDLTARNDHFSIRHNCSDGGKDFKMLCIVDNLEMFSYFRQRDIPFNNWKYTFSGVCW